MNEIKIKYPSLFRLTKSVFKESNSLEDLKDIRDEEIAFIVSYIGAYIERDSLEILKKKRILIVCPNGITVTKTLQYQLEKHFPQLHIVDSLPLSKLKTINRNDYDWIISTVEIRDTQNVIMVNPLLKNSDLSIISKNIFHDLPGNAQLSIDDLITIYGKYGEIRDIDGLKNELYKKVFNKKNHKGGSKMLSELLTKDKIKIVDICENWQSAIKEAANVLLEKGEIEDSYVNAMIQSLVDHGPYIVLDDYLALAHARPEDGVNELSMSLLKISKGFDLLGKEVKLLIVLAASDNEKHIKALSSLTDLFMDKKNIDIILNTNDIDVIFELIKKYS